MGSTSVPRTNHGKAMFDLQGAGDLHWGKLSQLEPMWSHSTLGATTIEHCDVDATVLVTIRKTNFICLVEQIGIKNHRAIGAIRTIGFAPLCAKNA